MQPSLSHNACRTPCQQDGHANSSPPPRWPSCATITQLSEVTNSWNRLSSHELKPLYVFWTIQESVVQAGREMKWSGRSFSAWKSWDSMTGSELHVHRECDRTLSRIQQGLLSSLSPWLIYRANSYLKYRGVFLCVVQERTQDAGESTLSGIPLVSNLEFQWFWQRKGTNKKQDPAENLKNEGGHQRLHSLCGGSRDAVRNANLQEYLLRAHTVPGAKGTRKQQGKVEKRSRHRRAGWAQLGDSWSLGLTGNSLTKLLFLQLIFTFFNALFSV